MNLRYSQENSSGFFVFSVLVFNRVLIHNEELTNFEYLPINLLKLSLNKKTSSFLVSKTGELNLKNKESIKNIKMISLKNISKTYIKPSEKIEQKVLDSLSVKFCLGKISLIQGENGSGKSTLFKIMVGLIKSDNGFEELRKKLYYLPETVSLPENLSVKTFAESFNVPKNFLEKFDFKNKLNNSLKELSKGMKRKLQLLTCLNSQAEVILLDEPFSGIDDESMKEFEEELKKISVNKIILITSHLQSLNSGFYKYYKLEKGKIFEAN